MAKKHILYVQFNIGEIGKLEQRSLGRVAGDLANFSFIPASLLTKVKIDLIHDCDQVILGPAPLDFPEELEAGVAQFVDELIATNYPTLGIGFGHLILAQKMGFQVIRSQEYAELDQIIEYQVRNPQSEISPTFDLDLAAGKPQEPVFYAYTNHYDSIVDGDRSKAIITSELSPYAAIAYTNKIYSIQFIPFLDEATFKWWVRPYPDFWRNLKGFWVLKNLRENTFFNRLIRWYTYKFRYNQADRDVEEAYQAKLADEWRDLSKSINLLRNFIAKVNKV